MTLLRGFLCCLETLEWMVSPPGLLAIAALGLYAAGQPLLDTATATALCIVIISLGTSWLDVLG